MTAIYVPVAAHAMPHRSPAELIALARKGLAEAPSEAPARFAAAHLSALRAAAALVAHRGQPAPGRSRRITSVWVLVTVVAPELGEWAAWFAAASKAAPIAEHADRVADHAARWIAAVEEAIR
jgi:hypothetical protein